MSLPTEENKELTAIELAGPSWYAPPKHQQGNATLDPPLFSEAGKSLLLNGLGLSRSEYSHRRTRRLIAGRYTDTITREVYTFGGAPSLLFSSPRAETFNEPWRSEPHDWFPVIASQLGFLLNVGSATFYPSLKAPFSLWYKEIDAGRTANATACQRPLSFDELFAEGMPGIKCFVNGHACQLEGFSLEAFRDFESIPDAQTKVQAERIIPMRIDSRGRLALFLSDPIEPQLASIEGKFDIRLVFPGYRFVQSHADTPFFTHHTRTIERDIYTLHLNDCIAHSGDGVRESNGIVTLGVDFIAPAAGIKLMHTQTCRVLNHVRSPRHPQHWSTPARRRNAR